MAEALALTASIVAIIQIAGAATKISRTLYRVARKAGTASDDIHAFAVDIGSFASIIGVAHTALSSHCANACRTPVLKYLEDFKVLEQLVTQSERIMDQLEMVKPEIKSIPSRMPLISLFKWFIHKSDVKALGPEMEKVKSSLMLVMTVIRFETIQQEEPSQENKQEIKFLKAQIKVQMETITFQQELLSRRPGGLSTGSKYSLSSVIYDEHSPLFDLGKTMKDQGRVPISEVSSISTSDSSGSSTEGSQSSTSDTISQEPSTQTIVRTRTHDSAMHPPSPHVPMAMQSPLIEEDFDGMGVVRSTNMKPKPQLSPTIAEIAKPAPPNQDESGIGVLLSRPNYQSSSSHSTYRDEHDFLDVHPINRVFRLNPKQDFQRETGYISTTSGLEPVTACLYPDFQLNLISAELATSLDLNIQPLEDGNAEIWVALGEDHREECVGTVRFKWNLGNGNNESSFTVHCWVCEHNVGDLIFGVEYVKKKTRYWTR